MRSFKRHDHYNYIPLHHFKQVWLIYKLKIDFEAGVFAGDEGDVLKSDVLIVCVGECYGDVQ